MQGRSEDELEFLAEISLFSTLAHEDLEKVTCCIEHRRFRRGEVIYHRGDKPLGLYIVLSGEAKTRVLLPDDRQLTLHLFHRTGYFGMNSLLDDKERSTDAVAVTECEMLFFPRESFLQYLDQHPAACRELLHVMAGMYRTAAERVLDLALLDVSARVAKELDHLCRMAERDAGDDVNCLTINQAELASLVGATRESINKWLRFFEHEGWIELSRGRIHIRNLNQIRQRAASY